jgi:phage tail-like protein
MPGGRAFSAGRFLLELDGIPCGFLHSVEGGAIRADVVAVPGQSYFDEKHLGQLRYEDFVVRLDLSLEKAVYDWITDTWNGKWRRRDGSIVAVDVQLKAVSEHQFFQALLTEVTVPAMDAASKDPAYLTMKFAPEYTRM